MYIYSLNEQWIISNIEKLSEKDEHIVFCIEIKHVLYVHLSIFRIA